MKNSKEVKHTPGPWNSRTAGDENDRTGTQIYSGENNIATCHYGKTCDHNEASANARLIAAAPDLLEACKMAINICAGMSYSGVRVDKIKEAIAKAQGK